MIAEGAVLAVIGLVVVFLFLSLLVLVMYLISAIARRLPGQPTAVTAAGPGGSREAEIAAAVAAARAHMRWRRSGGSQ